MQIKIRITMRERRGVQWYQDRGDSNKQTAKECVWICVCGCVCVNSVMMNSESMHGIAEK